MYEGEYSNAIVWERVNLTYDQLCLVSLYGGILMVLIVVCLCKDIKMKPNGFSSYCLVRTNLISDSFQCTDVGNVWFLSMHTFWSRKQFYCRTL